MADVLHIKAYKIRRLIPRGTRPTMQTLPAITRTHTKRARTQIADRPARRFVPVPLGLSPERYAFGMIYLIFTLQQKPIWSHAREGVSTSGICWDKGIAFLQPKCASKDGTFERENCYVTPPDGLTAGTLRVFGLRGSTSRGIYRTSSVSLRTK